MFRKYLAAVPNLVPPAEVSYYKGVDLQMFLNDKESDCTCASAGNMVLTWSKETNVQESVTDSDVQGLYNLVNGGQDEGAVESTVLQTWRNTGLQLASGNYHKLLTFAPMSVKNKTDMLKATWLFGAVYLGGIITQSAMQQFQAGDPWDLTKKGDNILGGHAFPVLGYDKDYLYVSTWGTAHPMTWRWWQRWGEEAWGVIPPEFKQIGHGVTGAEMTQLETVLQTMNADSVAYWAKGA